MNLKHTISANVSQTPTGIQIIISIFTDNVMVYEYIHDAEWNVLNFEINRFRDLVSNIKLNRTYEILDILELNCDIHKEILYYNGFLLFQMLNNKSTNEYTIEITDFNRNNVLSELTKISELNNNQSTNLENENKSLIY